MFTTVKYVLVYCIYSTPTSIKSVLDLHVDTIFVFPLSCATPRDCAHFFTVTRKLTQ